MPIKLMLVSVFINRMAYPCCISALSLTLSAALIVKNYINPPPADQPQKVITVSCIDNGGPYMLSVLTLRPMRM